MHDELISAHLERLRGATTHKYNRSDIVRWVCQNTYLNGKRFTTAGHEYQEKIMLDTSQEIVVLKAAQMGVSELSLRWSLGLVAIMPNFSLIYTMPTATLAGLYAKTRLDPIIQSSPVLREAIRGELDSAESKQLGPNNFLYVRGAAAGNSAIAVSADCIVNDELSFSDPHIIEMTNSRLIHSPWKLKLQLSTPTYPGDAISSAFSESRRHFNFVRCSHCSHMFYPDYWNHVKIPGFDGSLKEMTKTLLTKVRYEEARLLCPQCGKAPDLSPMYRQWVIENAKEKFVAAGYKLSPFDAPSFIPIPSLIAASTKYDRMSQFMNFHLGEPAEDSENGFTEEDMEKIGVQLAATPFTSHVMGIDVGQMSHFMVGSLDSDGRLGVVHMERVPLAKFRERFWALKGQYAVSITVIDVQPFSDLVMSISAEDPNLFGASYISRNGLEMFDVRMRDADPDSALLGIRQVHVNRNANFDHLLAEVRAQNVWVKKTGDWDMFKAHMMDMKRATATLRNGEFSTLWQKSSKGHDHYHHALGYLSIAARMRGVVSSQVMGLLPGVSTFKHRPKG